MCDQTIQFPELRVLVVEDCKVNCTVMVRMLSQLGCVTTVAVDGQEAVEEVGCTDFDLILMDIQMPVMDGLQATRLIRQGEDPQTHRNLIIAVTAGFAREPCLDAGMDDHLQKPVHVADLVAVLKQWLPDRMVEIVRKDR